MPVIKKIPMIQVDWPPYGGKPMDVGPSDNWWEVAKKCGRSNVWHPIYFNFQTTVAEEVNWYMEHHLGCNILAPDKKNYKFGRKTGKNTIEKVTIYEPPPGWEPPPTVKLPKPPERPPMSLADQGLAKYAASVLRRPALGWVNFNIGPHHLSYMDFQRVAQWIDYGVIAVYVQPNADDTAEYNPEENSLYVKKAYDIEDDAMIVHEAVHAIFDMKKAYNILTVDDEAAGYLAATIFAQKHTGRTARVLQGYDIYLKAFELAQRYFNNEILTYESFAPLRRAITEHPKYKPTANRVAEYDGVFFPKS